MNLGELYRYLRGKFTEISVENIIWWINLSPKRAGISLLSHDNSVIFWAALFLVLSYMNFYSNFVNRIILSNDMENIIRANTNLSLVILTVNISIWYLTKRSLVISTIKKVKEIDKMSSEVESLGGRHKQLIKRVKMLVLLYYTFNMFNIFLIWLPLRSDISSNLYTEDPCPGLDVTKAINKHVCQGIVFFQDTLVTIVVINYQSLLLFFIAHTEAMYTLISEEILSIDHLTDEEVKSRLAPVIARHILLLDIVKSLQSLYNVPIGIDFGNNAYFFCLFFTLPLEDWVTFGPILGYCFIVFFLYCLLCQKLRDSSVIFEKSVYACGWENFGVSDKKTTLIVLKLSQRPVLLLAAHIIPIDINTFASTVQVICFFHLCLRQELQVIGKPGMPPTRACLRVVVCERLIADYEEGS